MFFISLNILKALIVSIDMEIQSKNLNLRLGDRLEKKSYTVSNSIYCDRISRSLMSFAVTQLNGCVLHFCITVLQKKRSAPLITNKRVPYLMQIEPQKQEPAILASCLSSCKLKAVELKTRANGSRQGKRYESDKIRYFYYNYML